MTGDFNVESDSTICDHLRKSGYYSAFEVCPPMQDDCLSMACQLQQQQQQNQASASALAAIPSSSCNIASADAQDSLDENAVELIEKKESSSISSSSNHNDNGRNALLQGLELPLSSLGKKIAWLGGTNHERKTAKKFVSHRTHRNEELGVDHIFIKVTNYPPLYLPYVCLNNPLCQFLTKLIAH